MKPKRIHLALSPVAAILGATLAHAQLTLVETGGTFRGDAVNLAIGATAIGLNEYGSPHFIANINDGLYGNAHSWLGYSDDDPVTWVGVGFASPSDVASIAFGRDNTGGFSDRASLDFTIQYSTDPTAGADPFSATWITIGTLDYGISPPPSQAFRHLYNLDTPLSGVYGLRIVTTAEAEIYDYYDEILDMDIYTYYTGQAIDELEIYSTGASAIPEPSAFAVLAGLGALGFAASRRRR